MWKTFFLFEIGWNEIYVHVCVCMCGGSGFCLSMHDKNSIVSCFYIRFEFLIFLIGFLDFGVMLDMFFAS